MLTALMQEPWCYPPDVVASLTDYQVWDNYLVPAYERAERARAEAEESRPPGPPAPGLPPREPRRRRAKGDPKNSGPDFEPGTPGHRRQIVEMAFMGVMGMSRARAEALYEKQLAEWRAQQAGG